MENNVKTKLMMLAVWSIVMLQSGMLSTSYIVYAGSKNVSAYSVEKEQQITEDENTKLEPKSIQVEGSAKEKEIAESITAEEESVTKESTSTSMIAEKTKIAVDTLRAKREAETEEKEAKEAEKLVKEETEKLAREIAEKLAKKEEERLAKKEEERLAREEAERLAKEEEERLAREEAERLAKEEAERLAREEAERLAKEEVEKLAREEAERLAKEEAERLAREEAERLAKEEAERLAREEAERLAKEEAEARMLNTDPNTLTFLVNKEYVLPKNYVPQLVEPKVNHCQPADSHKRYMRAEAAEALEEMFAAAKEDGYELWVKTAYRSYKNQYDTYTWVLKYRGVQEAVYYHAVPGRSEHQTGLAVDIVCEASNYENELGFEKTKEYTWLKENCYKYGFILRYMEGMEHITGYNYEPWHYRYVGVELATYLTEHKMTLEEYYYALPTTDLFQVPQEYQYLIQENTESNSAN